MKRKSSTGTPGTGALPGQADTLDALDPGGSALPTLEDLIAGFDGGLDLTGLDLALDIPDMPELDFSGLPELEIPEIPALDLSGIPDLDTMLEGLVLDLDKALAELDLTTPGVIPGND